jgi:hypothetical protein
MRSSLKSSGKERAGFILLATLIGSLVWLSHSNASKSAGWAPIGPVGFSDIAPQKRKNDKKPPSCTYCAPPGNQEIYVPLIDLPEAKGAEIVFNSRSPQAMDVTPVFYKRNGETVIADAVRIESAEIRYVNVMDLLPERYRHEHNWGGFALTYNGFNREMWSQFRFIGVNGGGNVDEFFTVKDEARSDTFEAAWWTPEKSEAIVALGNITDAATSASVTFGGDRTRTVKLPAHATELVRDDHSKADGPVSVKINVTGAVGSVIPTGIITSEDGSFNSVIRFYDPTKAKQSNLYANGFRLTGNTPHMVLKNTTSSSIAVVPKFVPLSGEAAGPFTLSQVVMPPNGETEVDLKPLMRAARKRHDLDVVSIEVTNYAGPGSIIGSLYGINDTDGTNYDIPLRDSGLVRTMTGSYPWKIDDDFTTVAYITNISDQQAEFIGQINFDGGHFVIDPRKLNPGETAVFDFEKIRHDQEADNAGASLPLNASLGQFKWAIHGVTNGKLLLIGRAEMVSRSNHISTSYSCNDPCPPYMVGWLDGLQTPIIVTGTSNTSAWQTAYYDSGYSAGPYSSGASWSVDSAAIAIDPSSAHATTVTGENPGDGCVTADMGSQERYSWDGQNCYDNNFADPISDTGCTTAFTFSIDSNVLVVQPSGAGDTNTTTITIRITPRMPNLAVHLSLSAEGSSGGHVSHSGTRPLGTLEASQGTTNELGAFQTTYTAPIFGGLVNISGSVGGIPAEQAVQVLVAVENLSELYGSAEYSVIGQTTTHPGNHWGTDLAITNLPLIAHDYLSQFPGADILQYNDMSLVYGGKFDLDHDWSASSDHAEHRIGINCDVSSSNVPTSRRSALTAIFAQRGSPNYLDETSSKNHWHLRFQ